MENTIKHECIYKMEQKLCNPCFRDCIKHPQIRSSHTANTQIVGPNPSTSSCDHHDSHCNIQPSALLYTLTTVPTSTQSSTSGKTGQTLAMAVVRTAEHQLHHRDSRGNTRTSPALAPAAAASSAVLRDGDETTVELRIVQPLNGVLHVRRRCELHHTATDRHHNIGHSVTRTLTQGFHFSLSTRLCPRRQH